MSGQSRLLYGHRRATNFVILALSLCATSAGLAVLFFILYSLLRHGLPALSSDIITKMTPPPGSQGGLANAIYGSVIAATAIGTPVGILTGTYLAEFSRGSRLGQAVRFVNDILLSAPSIVIGLFVYEVMVVPMGHFSAWAGTAALAIIVVPVVVRTSENMLSLVRIAGETAPLLFTALNNQFWSVDMNGAMANLPVVIFQFALSPYADWQLLAWGGALLITITILLLNILARFVAGWSSFAK